MMVQTWMYYNATATGGARPRANLEGLPPSLVKGAGCVSRPASPCAAPASSMFCHGPFAAEHHAGQSRANAQARCSLLHALHVLACGAAQAQQCGEGWYPPAHLHATPPGLMDACAHCAWPSTPCAVTTCAVP